MRAIAELKEELADLPAPSTNNQIVTIEKIHELLTKCRSTIMNTIMTKICIGLWLHVINSDWGRLSLASQHRATGQATGVLVTRVILLCLSLTACADLKIQPLKQALCCSMPSRLRHLIPVLCQHALSMMLTTIINKLIWPLVSIETSTSIEHGASHTRIHEVSYRIKPSVAVVISSVGWRTHYVAHFNGLCLKCLCFVKTWAGRRSEFLES